MCVPWLWVFKNQDSLQTKVDAKHRTRKNAPSKTKLATIWTRKAANLQTPFLGFTFFIFESHHWPPWGWHGVPTLVKVNVNWHHLYEEREKDSPQKSMLWQNPLRFSLIPKNKVFFWKDFGWITHVFIDRKNLSWRKRVQYERKTLWSSKWRTGLQGNCSSWGVQLVRWNRDTFWLLWNSRWLCGFIFLTLYIFSFFLESLCGLGPDFGRHLKYCVKEDYYKCNSATNQE